MAFIPAVTLGSVTSNTRRNTFCPAPPRHHYARRSVMRMVATEPVTEEVTTTSLSERAMELMSYVRGHKSIFQAGKGFYSVPGTLFRKNDTARLFTPVDELHTNASELPGMPVALFMVENSDALVDTAFEAAQQVYPSLGSDDDIVDILRYDVLTILRTVSYGAAVKSNDFLQGNNAAMLRLLHEEVGIPREAMTAALNAAKDMVINGVDAELRDSTASCFRVVLDIFA